MAPRAPKPGTTHNSARKRAKRSGWKVTIGPDTWILRSADIGAEDDFLVRRQTNGTPLSRFLTSDSFGIDSIAIIVWVARRKAGEKRLTLQRVMQEMPSFEEIDELTENDEFEFDLIEDIDEDQDGLLELESEEVVSDPLPSGGA